MNLSTYNPLPSNKGSSESSPKTLAFRGLEVVRVDFRGRCWPRNLVEKSASVVAKITTATRKKNNKNIVTTIIYSKTVNLYLYTVYNIYIYDLSMNTILTPPKHTNLAALTHFQPTVDILMKLARTLGCPIKLFLRLLQPTNWYLCHGGRPKDLWCVFNRGPV